MNAAIKTPESTGARRSSELIAATLIEEIKAGQLPVDQPLPTERELSARFDASRPTVRAALSQMQLQGYATSLSGHRPRAARPSLDGILRGAGDLILDLLGDAEAGAHLEQMRQFIEMGAAREAATRAGNVQLAKLKQMLELNGAAIGTATFAETDIAFHRAIVRVIGNPVMLTLHDMFVSRLIAQRPATDNPVEYDRIAHDEHRAIYAAILDGKGSAAAEIMDRHLARSYRRRLKAAIETGLPDGSRSD